MAFLAFLIAVVLIVVAIRGTQGTLFSALMTDVPGFAVWAGAIFALALIGFVPGLKPISRGLLALVILVIVLRNYQNVLASFQGLVENPTAGGSSSSDGGSGGGVGGIIKTGASVAGDVTKIASFF